MGSRACRNKKNQYHHLQGSYSLKGGARHSTKAPHQEKRWLREWSGTSFAAGIRDKLLEEVLLKLNLEQYRMLVSQRACV